MLFAASGPAWLNGFPGPLAPVIMVNGSHHAQASHKADLRDLPVLLLGNDPELEAPCNRRAGSVDGLYPRSYAPRTAHGVGGLMITPWSVIFPMESFRGGVVEPWWIPHPQ